MKGNYTDFTFREFADELNRVGLSLCWDVDKKNISVGKREIANPMLWFNPRTEKEDYTGTVKFKSINTPLFTEKQIYTALRLVDSLLMTDLKKREID